MITPSFLKSGDIVGITATASFVTAKSMQFAIKTLNDWGLDVIVSKTVGRQKNQFADSDESRLHEMQLMLDNPGIKAIFCARGGYGTIRIIDKIDFSKFIENPKWIIGFSDITVLHSHINNFFGIRTIHGPMPKTFVNDAESNKYLKDALWGNLKKYNLKGNKKNIPGNSSGMLIGGNLSIIHNLIGSVSDFDPENKILLLEDTGEYYYNIDRMLWGLKRAKDLGKLSGVIAGNFSGIKDHKTPFGKTVTEIITGNLLEYNIPICFDFPAGHEKVNYSLYLGRQINLEIKKDRVNLGFL